MCGTQGKFEPTTAAAFTTARFEAEDMAAYTAGGGSGGRSLWMFSESQLLSGMLLDKWGSKCCQFNELWVLEPLLRGLTLSHRAFHKGPSYLTMSNSTVTNHHFHFTHPHATSLPFFTGAMNFRNHFGLKRPGQGSLALLWGHKGVLCVPIFSPVSHSTRISGCPLTHLTEK